MDTKSLDAIKDQLQDQQAKLVAAADKLRSELIELDDDRERIEAALAALSGVGLPAMNGKKKHEKKRASAPSASKAQVVALIAEELSKHHVIEEEELKACIEKKLVDTGYTRMGYSLRFKEAVADLQFFKAPDGIRLNAESTTSGLHKSFTIGTSTCNGTSSSSSGHTTSHTKSTSQNS